VTADPLSLAHDRFRLFTRRILAAALATIQSGPVSAGWTATGKRFAEPAAS
jgi:hypothetical protein